MRLNLVGGIVAAFVIVALIVAYASIFTVYQTRQAIVVRLGEPGEGGLCSPDCISRRRLSTA